MVTSGLKNKLKKRKMIQLNRPNTGSGINQIYLNLFDEYDKSVFSDSYNPLIMLENQQTNKKKYFISAGLPNVVYGNRDRYVYIFIFVTDGFESLTQGQIYLGESNYPYGFYNVKIWQQSSSSNLDPNDSSVVKQVFDGIAYLTNSDNLGTTYTEYTTTQSSPVYVTN
mgnify:FL=1